MMNYKCQPVTSYLEQAINVLTWLLLVEERFGLQGNKYLMHWNFEIFFDVTEKQNVNASAIPWDKTIKNQSKVEFSSWNPKLSLN